MNPPLSNVEARRPFTLSSRLITPYNDPQCGLYESFYRALRRIFMTDSKDVFYGSPPQYWVLREAREVYTVYTGHHRHGFFFLSSLLLQYEASVQGNL